MMDAVFKKITDCGAYLHVICQVILLGADLMNWHMFLLHFTTSLSACAVRFVAWILSTRMPTLLYRNNIVRKINIFRGFKVFSFLISITLKTRAPWINAL